MQTQPTGTVTPFPRERMAERHAVDLLVRYAWKGLRATVMLKDLTRHGARIEGIEALRPGDGPTLLLPGLPPCDATVAWAAGRVAGLSFDQPLPQGAFDALVRDYAPVAPGPLTACRMHGAGGPLPVRRVA